MARVTVEDCLENVTNRFDLVVTAAKRARDIAMGAEPMVPMNQDKPTVVALREIAENKINKDVLDDVSARTHATDGLISADDVKLGGF